jgi:uncharacterized protein YkwD
MRTLAKSMLTLLLFAGVTSLPCLSGPFVSALDGTQGPAQPAQKKATLKPATVTTPETPFKDSDPEAEEQLFQLANQARRKAGAPPLTLDPGLSQAARTHARVMLEARALSHQFDGEPSLPQRLAIATQLQMDEEAENVALDNDAAHGHELLMLSPPHRANLLNPSYNVVGLGVVHRGDRLYIVQDFGHALPNYSETELKDRIASTVLETRRSAGQNELQRRDLLIADDVACTMAQADKLGTPVVRKLSERFTVLTYTSLHPETLPTSAARVIAGRNAHGFSIGACFARTDTYPTGVYWVVLSLD